jgi:osmotically-inducible protein OsmY
MKSDSKLHRDVLAELRWDSSVNAAQIGVSVKDGVVTLTGHAPSLVEKHAAEVAVKRVQGVRGVANEIEVELPGDKKLTDHEIAANSVKALHWNILLSADKIKITVAEGVVTLEGEVNWQFQKQAAEATIRFLKGVKGVQNRLKIKPNVPPSLVESKIEEALKRHAELSARQLNIEVAGDKIILRGVVHSLAEKDEVERVAWSAPGISTVDSRLVIEPV